MDVFHLYCLSYFIYRYHIPLERERYSKHLFFVLDLFPFSQVLFQPFYTCFISEDIVSITKNHMEVEQGKKASHNGESNQQAFCDTPVVVLKGG